MKKILNLVLLSLSLVVLTACATGLPSGTYRETETSYGFKMIVQGDQVDIILLDGVAQLSGQVKGDQIEAKGSAFWGAYQADEIYLISYTVEGHTVRLEREGEIVYFERDD